MTEKESLNLPKAGSIFTLLIIFLLSYILVVVMAVIIVPALVLGPPFIQWFFGFINGYIARPLFDKITPLGAIILLTLVIVAILYFARKPNIKAAASYLPGMGAVYSFIYYVRKEEDEVVKFHATQGMVLFFIASVLFIISLVLVNLGIETLAYAILFLLFIVGASVLIYMMYTTYKGEKVNLFSR
ncbi:MAG: hypothetical protein ACE5HY_01405 [Candidatus Hydrothermarchaeales archaeon]